MRGMQPGIGRGGRPIRAKTRSAQHQGSVFKSLGPGGSHSRWFVTSMGPPGGGSPEEAKPSPVPTIPPIDPERRPGSPLLPAHGRETSVLRPQAEEREQETALSVLAPFSLSPREGFVA